MKKILSMLLSVILILSMSACQAYDQISCPPADESDKQIAPGSIGSSKPSSKEPPELKVLDSTCLGIVANKGTYSWMSDNGDGTQTGVCADSSHPLEWQEFLVPMTTSDDTVELYFDVPPQEISVRCWSDAYWGKVDAKEENAMLNQNTLKLKDGGYIYEVVAKWTGANLAAEGTVHYAFYIVKDLHLHMSALRPETVNDPVTGYCGNTMTTIILEGNEYTFMGSDSVNLTDILINLKYDPMKICCCIPEFTVKTEFGEPYDVNLTLGYARCEEGQANLTVEQINLIQKILDNQT